MKKIIKITSLLSGAVALISLILGIYVLTGHGRYMTFALFSMVRRGTVMGFIGNLVSMVFTVIGFGNVCWYGLKFLKSPSESKSAFIWGCVMSILCFISLICSCIGHRFNFGDVVMLAVPVLYTIGIMKEA